MNIDTEKGMDFYHASLRYFNKGEHHIKRLCGYDVILFVFDGVLRFSEDGKEYEVGAGEYFVQKRGGSQDGRLPSTSPGYFYIHCKLHYSETGGIARRGTYDIPTMKPLFFELDRLCHQNGSFFQKNAVFYSIMSRLVSGKVYSGAAQKAAEYMQVHFRERVTLADLGAAAGYSKNQIINIFKKEYGRTPFEYLLRMRLSNAKMLMEVTSDSIEKISNESGFGDYSAFYKYFVKSEGVPPGKWRKMIYEDCGGRLRVKPTNDGEI